MESNVTKPISAVRWVITVAWAALIFHLSTEAFNPGFSRALLAWILDLFHLDVSPGTFGFLHASLRKLAHVMEYAVFALLLYGLGGDKSQRFWRPRRAVICILIAAAFSLTDEFHQFLVFGRHASLFDSGLDTIGAALAMLVPYTQEQMFRAKSNDLAPKS